MAPSGPTVTPLLSKNVFPSELVVAGPLKPLWM
jgi:hypothetical protein